MDTREAVRLTGLTDDKISYLIKRGVFTPYADNGQGKAREYSFRDLVILRLARLLREDGYKLDQVKEATEQVLSHWTNEEPDSAGGLRVIKNEFVWTSNSGMMLTSGDIHGESLTFQHIPKFFYDLKRLANEILFEMD